MSEFKIVEKVFLKQYYVLDPGCMNLIVLRIHNDAQSKQWRIEVNLEGNATYYFFTHHYEQDQHLRLIDENNREPGEALVLHYARETFRMHSENLERKNNILNGLRDR